MSDKKMYLVAATDVVNSECETPLDVTEKEWLDMNEGQRSQLTGEYMGNIVDIWVEARDER